MYELVVLWLPLLRKSESIGAADIVTIITIKALLVHKISSLACSLTRLGEVGITPLLVVITIRHSVPPGMPP